MRYVQFASAMTVFVLLGGSEAIRGSDIPGEVEPPPCVYNPDGSLQIGVPACTGPMQFALLSGTGAISANTSPDGSISNPWLLSQQLSSANAVLGLSGGFGLAPSPPDAKTPGNATDSGHWFGRVFSLSLTNDTSSTWTGFYLELQSILGLPSDQADGLSFGEKLRNPQTVYLTPSSNVFSNVSIEVNKNASIRFAGGTVAPGASVDLNFFISDDGPNSPFFLIEQPSIDATPEPATFALCATGVLLAFTVQSVQRRRQPRPEADRPSKLSGSAGA